MFLASVVVVALMCGIRMIQEIQTVPARLDVTDRTTTAKPLTTLGKLPNFKARIPARMDVTDPTTTAKPFTTLGKLPNFKARIPARMDVTDPTTTAKPLTTLGKLPNFKARIPARLDVTDPTTTAKPLTTLGKLPNFKARVQYAQQCMRLNVSPYPFICIHPVDKDIYISEKIARDGVYERDIVHQFTRLLKSYSNDVGFLDIGANIGQYSLIAAGLGHKVVAVEPFIPNHSRFVEAVYLNRLETRVSILNKSITNVRGYFDLVQNKDNQGATRIEKYDSHAKAKTGSDVGWGETESIFLDDVLRYCTFKSAIMKMDIEGSEPFAFQHAEELFTKLSILYVIVEWTNCCTLTKDPEKLKVAQQMVDFFTSRGFTPHDIHKTSLPMLNIDQWRAWPPNILWKGKQS